MRNTSIALRQNCINKFYWKRYSGLLWILSSEINHTYQKIFNTQFFGTKINTKICPQIVKRMTVKCYVSKLSLVFVPGTRYDIIIPQTVKLSNIVDLVLPSSLKHLMLATTLGMFVYSLKHFADSKMHFIDTETYHKLNWQLKFQELNDRDNMILKK